MIKFIIKKTKPIVWLNSEIKTPPFSPEARQEAGKLLRRLQDGIEVTMPFSRPLPVVGAKCHELRVWDYKNQLYWRIIYRIDCDAIVVGYVFVKKTQQLLKQTIKTSKSRFESYDFVVKNF